MEESERGLVTDLASVGSWRPQTMQWYTLCNGTHYAGDRSRAQCYLKLHPDWNECAVLATL